MEQSEKHTNKNQHAPYHFIRHHIRQQQLQVQHDNEVREEVISLPYRKAYEMAEKFAATRIGQFLFKRCDRILKTIETTAKWSLPKAQPDENLARPLPWLPFLMLIITLRLARVWLSIACLMIGNSPITANDVIYFIQTRRRKLRYLRLNGIKEMTVKNSKNHVNRRNTFKFLFKSIFNRAICRPGQLQLNSSEPVIYVTGEKIEPGCSNVAGRQAAKRIRIDNNDEVDSDLNVNQLIDKYSGENSDEDLDFEISAESVFGSETNDDEDEAVYSEYGSDEISSQPEDHSQHIQSNEKVENINNAESLTKNTESEPKKMNSNVKKNEKNTKAASHVNEPINGDEKQAQDLVLKAVSFKPFSAVQSQNEITQKNPEKAAHTKVADTEQLKKPSLNSTAAAAAFDLAAVLSSMTAACCDVAGGGGDDVVSLDNTELVLTKLNALHNDSISKLSSSVSSSTSSLAFLIENEEISNEKQEFSTATTTPTNEYDEKQFDDLTTRNLASISSSEDDFYSPIGSPQNFNASHQQPPPLSPGLTNMPTTQNPCHDPIQKIVIKDQHYPSTTTDNNKSTDNTKHNQNQRGAGHGQRGHGKTSLNGNFGHHPNQRGRRLHQHDEKN